MVRQLAHEIKNPLGGLARGGATARTRAARAPALHEYTGVIISRGGSPHRAGRFALIGPGAARRSKALINVHEICANTSTACCAAEARAGVLVERDYDPSLPNAAAPGCRNQIIQALLNIATQRAAGRRGARPHRDPDAHRALTNVNIGSHVGTELAVESCRWKTTGRECRPNSSRHRSSFRWSRAARDRHGSRPRGRRRTSIDASRRSHRIRKSSPGRTVFTILLPLPENA